MGIVQMRRCPVCEACGAQHGATDCGLRETQGALPSASTSPLPLYLQHAMERPTGQSLSDVVVHHNAAEPGRLGALALATDSDIFLGPGQDDLLAHEAWHVVQQRQGRVAATHRMAGAAVNADPVLEIEAETVAQAFDSGTSNPEQREAAAPRTGATTQRASDPVAGQSDASGSSLQNKTVQPFLPFLAAALTTTKGGTLALSGAAAAAAALALTIGASRSTRPWPDEWSPPQPDTDTDVDVTDVDETAILATELARRERKLTDLSDLVKGLKIELAYCLEHASEMKKEECAGLVEEATRAINLALRRIQHWLRNLLLFSSKWEEVLDGQVTDAETKHFEAMSCLECIGPMR